MKNLILALTFLLVAGDAISGPITIYGRPKISGNSVECFGGRKLCAVIPRAMDEDPEIYGSVITIYNDDGSVLGEFPFSSYAINETAEGTTITWLP